MWTNYCLIEKKEPHLQLLISHIKKKFKRTDAIDYNKLYLAYNMPNIIIHFTMNMKLPMEYFTFLTLLKTHRVFHTYSKVYFRY